MPYFVSSIIAIVSAVVIIFSRFEGGNSDVIPELEKVKSMMKIVDGYVDTYLASGGLIENLSSVALRDSGILLSGSCVSTEPTLYFPSVNMTVDAGCTGHDGVIFQVASTQMATAGSASAIKSQLSSYVMFVKTSPIAALNSNPQLTETYIAKEVCEKTLFGKAYTNGNHLGTNFALKSSNYDNDGMVICVIAK